MLDWRKRIPRKRYQRVILGISIALVLLVGVLFTPSIQKKIVLAQAENYVTSLELDYLHVLPWSITIEGLQLSLSNLDIAAERTELSFCVTKLLWRVLHIDELRVSSLAIKIAASESNQDKPINPGLFAAINHGYRVGIDEIVMDAVVELPDKTSVAVDIPSGALLADGRGSLAIDVDFDSPSNRVSAHAEGEISITQSALGVVDEIAPRFDISVSSEADISPSDAVVAQAKTVSLAVDSVLKPWLEDGEAQEGEEPHSVILGDLIALSVKIPSKGAPGVEFSSDTAFEITKQRFNGAFDLEVAAPWVEQILGNAALPSVAESGTGEFAFDLGELALTLDYQGDTKFTTLERLFRENPVLPDYLRFHKALSIESDLRDVTITTLQTGLTASDESKLLTLALTEPIEFPIDDPFAAIADDKNIGRFDVEELPIEWLGGFVPEATLRDGRMSGNFIFKAQEGALRLIPEESLSISATSIRARDLPEQVVSLSMRPQATLSKQTFSAIVDNLSLLVGEDQAVDAALALQLPLSGEDTAMQLSGNANVSLDQIKNLSVMADYVERYPTPANLFANVDVDVLVRPKSLTVNKANVRLLEQDEKLLSAQTLQTFVVPMGGDFALNYQPGRLASIAVENIDLAWANPYLGDFLVNGKLAAASFALEHENNDSFAIIADEPMQIRQFAAAKSGDRLLQNIFLRLSPTIRLKKDELALDYKRMRISHGRANLVAGDGSVSIKRTAEGFATDAVALSGNLRAHLNELAGLPLASAVVAYEFGQTNWQVSMHYDVDYGAKEILLSDFDAVISANSQTRLTASSQGEVRIQPQIGPDDALAQHVIGDFDLAVKNLTGAEVEDLIPLNGFAFEALEAEMVVSSDGSILSAIFEQPIMLRNASLKTKTGPLINPFNLILKGGLRTSGENLDAALDQIRLSFVDKESRPAIDGDITFHIKPARPVPLEAMSANFRGDLPIILNQPVILPGHSLGGGSYQLSAQVHPDGNITGDANFGDLSAGEPLAVTEFRAQIDGKVSSDGDGFSFAMPIIGEGKTGSSDGLLNASLKAAGEAKKKLALDFSSDTFHLNDLLASISSITTKATPKSATKNNVPAPLDDEPDSKAFWDFLPLDSILRYQISRLYYTDYVIFNDVSGTISIRPQSLELQQLSAHFHDSPMTFNGGLTFLPNTPSPYDVKLLGKITDFNLSQFFSELVPGVKPRAEGLFGVSINAFGNSPNMPQFRNNLFFDMRLQSRDGLFRPLPPDSSLMLGASDVLGVVGEGLSYMPTGGFGAGALSRLVNYIKEIDYDAIDMRVKRGDSRDIIIEQFLVQSPTVRITADGGIDYEYGKDVLDSPLTLDARMNMSGKGAAILYSMALLENKKDDHGYYHGPAFEIRGSANEPTSNFAEIISAGAKGTVAGGVTRPISGLIGNVKHRWFGDETIPAETNLELTGESPSSIEDAPQTPHDSPQDSPKNSIDE